VCGWCRDKGGIDKRYLIFGFREWAYVGFREWPYVVRCTMCDVRVEEKGLRRMGYVVSSMGYVRGAYGVRTGCVGGVRRGVGENDYEDSEVRVTGLGVKGYSVLDLYSR
jgi:hypothetical protein